MKQNKLKYIFLVFIIFTLSACQSIPQRIEEKQKETTATVEVIENNNTSIITDLTQLETVIPEPYRPAVIAIKDKAIENDKQIEVLKVELADTKILTDKIVLKSKNYLNIIIGAAIILAVWVLIVAFIRKWI